LPTGRPWTPQCLVSGWGFPVATSSPSDTVLVGILESVGMMVRVAVVTGSMAVSITQSSVDLGAWVVVRLLMGASVTR
jgi:hypothetical protein